ncbi:MAG TPA: site-specific integrase [Streptosporangiaceae bacterium]|nr:site-specific integrase [Streptosporangiaceae bacterium]
MTQATSRRRGQGEDSIYWDASKNRYIGAVSLGFSPAGTRIRKKVTGRTKTEVRDKLRELHKQVEGGPRPRRRYTVEDALEDWLAVGLDGLSARTVTLYRGTIAKALREELGSVRLTDLTAADVQKALTSIASRVSTRTVQIAHNVLVRAIRHAERDDLVGRNVAALVKPPKGQLGGRPSKSLTLEQAVSLMAAARGTRLEAYVVLSLLSGMRTEEARALRWDHVVAWVSGQWVPVAEAGFDCEQVAVFVWRAERAGGDTKTPESRRTLALPRKCVEALREHRVRQAADRLVAGPLWQDHGLVFASAVGTAMDDHNVRRMFRVITEEAGLGTGWVPREMRHTFVSLLSARGVPVEAIALLAGHNQTATTELVYRHQIVPALTRGAEVMDQSFG